MKDLTKRPAFTLAEVLITLAIIGIVAALTIPTLVANYQKVQYITGLKKSYAEVTEALKLMANDNGTPDDLKSTDAFSGDNVVLGNAFKKYFKLAKDCGTSYVQNNESTKCMSDSVSDQVDGSGARTDMNYDDGMGMFPPTYYYNFITADGFSVSLDNSGAMNCEAGYYVNDKANLNMTKMCASIKIDVNGLKGPNCYGRDIFYFFITNGKGPALYPYGGSEGKDYGWGWLDAGGNQQFCTISDGNTSGRMCTGRVMEQGWQMNY